MIKAIFAVIVFPCLVGQFRIIGIVEDLKIVMPFFYD